MVDADIEGSNTDTFGPRSGAVPGVVVGGVVGGVVVPPPGRIQLWFAPPPQSQICIRVPSAELGPVASAHRFDCGLISWVPVTRHCWLPLPAAQSQICSFVPLAVAPPVTSRHLPNARIVPSSPTTHCWAAVPLQVKSCTAVPLALLAAATSRHLPP